MRNNSTWAPSALSPTPWPHDAWRPALTILAGFGAVVFYVVPPLAYLIVAAMLHLVDPRQPFRSADQLLIAQLVGYIPIAIYLGFVLPRVARTSLRDLGFRRPNASEMGTALLGTIVMWLAVTLIGAAIVAATHRHDTENAIALLKAMKTPAEQLAFFLLACVLAPMIEELIFRVFIFNALSKYFFAIGRGIAPLILAIVVSGAIFGAVHAGSVGQLLTVSVPLTVGGIVLAYVYARTHNYWASVTTHALFNSISVLAIFVFHQKP